MSKVGPEELLSTARPAPFWLVQESQAITKLGFLHFDLKNLIGVYLQKLSFDLPGGSVVKNPSANAGDTGSVPGPGGSHMPWSN